MGFPLHAPLGQAYVLWQVCIGELGEELVGGHHVVFEHIGLLPSVEGPHEHAKRVDVTAGGDLRACAAGWQRRLKASGKAHAGNQAGRSIILMVLGHEVLGENDVG